MVRQNLITILGPTASGKTALGIALAKEMDAAVISGDAYQIYKGMDIGTAKVTAEEAQGVPHELIDCLDPRKAYSAAMFQALAAQCIKRENEEGHIPILLGGTGLYVQGLLEGYGFLPKSENRSLYRELYEAEGAVGLERELRRRKAGESEPYIPKDPHRMMRELELLDEGLDIADAVKEKTLVYHGPVVGLFVERQELYRRIDNRVDRMIQQGLRDEVRRLLEEGVPEDAQSLRGIGYKEMIPVLRGDMTEEEGAALIKRNTRRFAKRQMTWFRRMPYIRWFDVTEQRDGMGYREIETYVKSYFRGE